MKVSTPCQKCRHFRQKYRHFCAGITSTLTRIQIISILAWKCRHLGQEGRHLQPNIVLFGRQNTVLGQKSGTLRSLHTHIYKPTRVKWFQVFSFFIFPSLSKTLLSLSSLSVSLKNRTQTHKLLVKLAYPLVSHLIHYALVAFWAKDSKEAKIWS